MLMLGEFIPSRIPLDLEFRMFSMLSNRGQMTDDVKMWKQGIYLNQTSLYFSFPALFGCVK